MKKSTLFLSVLTLLFLSSCDILDKVDDVNFDVKLYKTTSVNESASAANVTYTQTQTIDANSNSDIAKYSSKIKAYTITKITYTITDYDAPKSVTFSNGKFSFGAAGASSAILAETGNVDLKELNTSGAESTLIIDQAGLSTIADLLLKDSKVNITTSGMLSSTPVKFNVNTTIYVSVKANAL